MKKYIIIFLFILLVGSYWNLLSWTKIKNLTDANQLVSLQADTETSTFFDDAADNLRREVLAPIDMVIFHPWDTNGKNITRASITVENPLNPQTYKKTFIFDPYSTLAHGNVTFEIFDGDAGPAVRVVGGSSETLDLYRKIIIE